MKLLMISGDRSILAGKRGAFWYTLEELARHWERIDVICPKSQKPTTKSQNHSNYQLPITSHESPFPNVFLHSSPRGLLFQPQWILQKGSELIAKYHHDVMTVHDYPPFYNGIGARRLSRKTGVPHVLEIHHIVGYPKAASISEAIGRILSRLYLPGAIRKARAVRVVNADTKKVLGQWGAEGSKISVVPSFYLDATVLRPDASVVKTVDVVFCARLVANKGLLETIDAVAMLPRVRLLVIGDGPLRASAEMRTQRQKLTDRITFVGWLPTQAEVMKAMQSAKIFVMNSRSEGGPRSALEAMACGLPVIATRVGVMPEVIHEGENGLFTSGTPEDLSEKIKHLLSDAALQKRLGENALKIIDRFDRRTLIAGYAEFLQKDRVR